ncbi:hypothetical protein Tco_0961766 [Tanacetum coccineum]
MRTKDRITNYSTQQPIPTSTNDSNIKPTPYNPVTNQNISPISEEFSDNNNGSGNRWMRYEDGGESLENVVESGGGDGGLKGCLVPHNLGRYHMLVLDTETCPLRRGHLDRNLKEAKRDIDEDTVITKAGTKLL